MTRPEISVRVHPAMLPRTHPLAAVRGAFNAVFIEGDAAGELMLYGRGAGGLPTASAVLGDLIDAAHHLRAGSPARVVPAGRRPDPARPTTCACAWYLSIDVADRPGVLAAVAQVFGDHGVSIRSMEQVGPGRRGPADLPDPRGPRRGRAAHASTGCASSTSSTASAASCGSSATRTTTVAHGRRGRGSSRRTATFCR